MDYLRLLTSFRTECGGGIRLHVVSQALAEAITEEVFPISTAQVNQLWMQLLGLSTCVRVESNVINVQFMQLVAEMDDESPIPEMEIAICVAGSLWGTFCRLLAGQVGLAVGRAEPCDSWASHKRPKCRTTTRAMRDVLTDYIAAECPQLDSIAAVPAEDILSASADSGRTVDQTYRRLAFSRVGLKRVK